MLRAALTLTLTLLSLTTQAAPMDGEWKLAIADDPAQPWTDQWFLDGDKSTVARTDKGFTLATGPIDPSGSGHAVAWTNRSFEGDVRIEYDYTRVDNNLEHTSVCILYIQATGIGTEKFPMDLSKWRDLRRVPKMNLYYDNLNCYHISYACTGGKDNRYVRARRYPSKGDFDRDTRVKPSYENVDAFKPGETWHIVCQKIGRDITFVATRGDQAHTWSWTAKDHRQITGGRIGLRQMHHRESKYENFKVFVRGE